MRNPWALIVQSFAGLLFLMGLVFALDLWVNERAVGRAVLQATGSTIALGLLIPQMRFTHQIGRWYGSMMGAISFGLLLPGLPVYFEGLAHEPRQLWFKVGTTVIFAGQGEGLGA
jgi:hypothetical protein